MSPLLTLSDPKPEELGDSPTALLERLGKPACIHVRGADPSRTRALVTLLHGNEPSGVRAMYQILRAGKQPRVSCLWIVGAVSAALGPPHFAHRHLPGRRDLNRCFRSPFDDEEGRVARAILETLSEHRPEALLDLHNNTGHNPAYGISGSADAIHLGLTAWFGRRFVRSDLALGALVEAADEIAPSVTVECGRAGDPFADAVALRGVERFLASDLPVPTPCPRVEVYEEPVRVTLRAGRRLAIGDERQPAADLTLNADLDRHNWQEMAAGTRIGWLDGSDWPIEAVLQDGTDISPRLFVAEHGELRARGPVTPIMITTDAGIAASDCLFYSVRRAASR